MSTYVIGDVQGCSAELKELLDEISFDPSLDEVWFVGDLVNRGPDSLGVLRLVKNLGNRAIAILGNHDLHLLMVSEGLAKPHKNDTLDDVLGAPDRIELLEWLRFRPLFHFDRNVAMVHAGLLPQWTVKKAASLAAEVENALRGNQYRDFLRHLYGNRPNFWSKNLKNHERLRVIVNAMTRMRFCTLAGEMEFSHKAKIAPEGFFPWFDIPGRKSSGETVVFGHWSALGLMVEGNAAALDTGCLWGGSLTALRLEDRRTFQVACRGYADVKEWQ